MGSFTAQLMITKIRLLAQDPNGVRWGDLELLNWLNDAQREIVLYKPDAKAINTSIKLASGTKQSIPAMGLSLIKVVRNMGAAGTTPGKAILLVDAAILDSQIPDWHTATASGVALHYCYDDRDPKSFYVYPPQPVSSQYAEIVYAAHPAPMSTYSSKTDLDDLYINAMVDYAMYRAFSKDADFAGNGQRAMAHFQAFMAAVGGKRDEIEMRDDPNMRSNMPSASLRREGGGRMSMPGKG